MPCRPQKATSSKKQPGTSRPHASQHVPARSLALSYVRVDTRHSIYRASVSAALFSSPDYIGLYGTDKVHRRFLHPSHLDPLRTTDLSPLGACLNLTSYPCLFSPSSENRPTILLGASLFGSSCARGHRERIARAPARRFPRMRRRRLVTRASRRTMAHFNRRRIDI